MLASIISSKQKQSKMLAFPINYYGLIFKATQSVELFCAYLVLIETLWNVKKITVLFNFSSNTVLIETLWNVKITKR